MTQIVDQIVQLMEMKHFTLNGVLGALLYDKILPLALADMEKYTKPRILLS